MGDGTIYPGENERQSQAGSLIAHVYKSAGIYTVKVFDYNGMMTIPPVVCKIEVRDLAHQDEPVFKPNQNEFPKAADLPRESPAKRLTKKKFFIKIGPHAGYFKGNDPVLKEIYGSGYISYGGKIGIHLWKGLYLGFSYLQSQMTGKTSFTQDKTTLILTPITVSVLCYILNFGPSAPMPALVLPTWITRKSPPLARHMETEKTFRLRVV